jgi:hypothetical protein
MDEAAGKVTRTNNQRIWRCNDEQAMQGNTWMAKPHSILYLKKEKDPRLIKATVTVGRVIYQAKYTSRERERMRYAYIFAF